MRKLTVCVLLLLGMNQLVFANTTPEDDRTYADLERVSKITVFNGIHSWSTVDDDSIIVWATAFRPFLVDLPRKSHDLKFTHSIAVTSSAGSIHEKFDSVIIDGIRYPIKGIYKLDRASAKALGRRS